MPRKLWNGSGRSTRHAPRRRASDRPERQDRVIETLAAAWRQGNESQQAAAEEGLALLLPDAAEVLLRLARRDRGPELLVLADRVGALDDAGADSLARDRSAAVVRAFATALRESRRPPEVIQRWLAAALGHATPDVRALVLTVASARGGTVAEHLGRLAMNDPVPRVRVAAIQALGASHRREVLPLLDAALRRPAPDEQLAAAEALGSIPVPETVPLLAALFERTRLLRKERGPLQQAAARALAQLPREWTTDLLTRLARDQDPAVSAVAREALER